MRMLFFVGAFLLITACVTPAAKTQSEPAQAGEPAQAAAPRKPREVVCEMETPVGTHIPKRVCRYKDEIEGQATETQDALRTMHPNNAPIITGK